MKQLKKNPKFVPHVSKKRLEVSALIVAVILSAVLLIMVYGTGTLTWEQIFKAVGLDYGTQQSDLTDEETGNEPAANVKDLAADEICVTVIDVGQGDSTLIETPEMNVLIDGGDISTDDELCNMLREKGIKKLDYIFATHPHKDHIGGLIKVLKNFETGRMMMTNVPKDKTPTNNTYMNFLKTLKENGINTWLAGTDEQFVLDKGQLTVLSAGGYKDLNECSLVIKYVYGDTSFLFMGDAGFEVEQNLMADGADLKSDVLKAGHHGSKFSTGIDFLKPVSPQYVVVSCGRDNQYGYPSADVMLNVKRAGAELLRTDRDGDISFVSDGKSITVSENISKVA